MIIQNLENMPIDRLLKLFQATCKQVRNWRDTLQKETLQKSIYQDPARKQLESWEELRDMVEDAIDKVYGRLTQNSKWWAQ